MPARRAHRHDLRTIALYAWAIVREFRWTIAFLVLAVIVLAVFLFLGSEKPVSPLRALYLAWGALLNKDLPDTERPHLLVLEGVYPVFGFVIFGEGLLRFTALLRSHRRRGKEWMTVMASTYRDHVVLCGIGHVGYRVLERLLADGLPVVALDNDEQGRFVGPAQASGVPLLVRDIRDDTALTEAGVAHARVIVIATSDDIANLEVALDARRMNPGIRIVMRLFDQQVAAKLKAAGIVDEAFSASALAAPVVAEMAARGFRAAAPSNAGTSAAAPGPPR